MIRIALICSLLALLASAACFFLGSRRMKIGYARTTELVYGFQGMKEAHEVFEKKRQGWQAMLDSARAGYQKSLRDYPAGRAGLSSTEKTDYRMFLANQQQEIARQEAELEQRVREEDQKMTQGVLNQINSLTQEYGKEHGYDLILATTQDGSILYGDDAIDLTKTLLEALNRTYNPSANRSDSAHGSGK